MRLSVVLVHYHTPDLVAPAWAALERDAMTGGFELEGFLVDNGSRQEDRRRFGELPLTVLEPGTNLGYAGGVNLGVRRSGADVVVAMNPDVFVRPGCLSALCSGLDRGSAGEAAAVAGPRFFWDEAGRFLLPPTEPRGPFTELRSLLAQRAGYAVRSARRAWRRHAHRFWTARESYPCRELSGALLAFRRDAWERVGPFDEGFRLYFEETDWLWRLAETGLKSVYIPGAEAVHLFEQSSIREPASNAWFEASIERFRRRHYGVPLARMLSLVARRLPWGEGRVDLELPSFAGLANLPGRGKRAAWLEVSRSPAGFPAAGRPLDPGEELSCELPAEVLARLAPGRYRLRLVDAAGRDLAVETLDHA